MDATTKLTEKVCSRCRQAKPATFEFFYKRPDAEDGLKNHCKACCRLPRATVEEKFWNRVTKAGPDECWLWTGLRDERGYGRMEFGKGTGTRAHRYMAELMHGPLGPGMCALHRCDNTSCVNPAHIFVGTQADNVQDMIAKGRRVNGAPCGERSGKSKLKEAQVKEIKGRLAKGERPAVIARDYGVTPCTITPIRDGETWRHVK